MKGHILKSIIYVTSACIVRNRYSPLWDLARNKPDMKGICKQLIRCIEIFVSRSFIQKCRECEKRTDNMIIHLLCFCPYKERQQHCLWKLIYELLGHDEFKRCSVLDTSSQCAYVLKLATLNSNLCFSHLNITKATAKLLSL